MVALIDEEEATLKRFRRRGASIALEAANTAYEVRILPPNRVRIQGKLVGLFRKYERFNNCCLRHGRAPVPAIFVAGSPFLRSPTASRPPSQATDCHQGGRHLTGKVPGRTSIACR